MFAIWAAECVCRARSTTSCIPARWQQILDDAGAALVFASPKIAADLRPVTDVPIEIVGGDGLPNDAATAAPSAPADDTDPATLAWLFYTSGTTGRSKGAMLSHRNLMAMTVAHLADFDAPDENCSLVHGAPMSHGSGLYIPPYVLRGARQVIPESGAFEPGGVPRSVRAPPGLQRLPGADHGAAPRRDRPRRVRRKLRTIVYGGGPMYVDSLKKAMAAFGPIFTQLYGQGEAPMTITGLRRADHLGADDAVLGFGRLRPVRRRRRGAATPTAPGGHRRDRRDRLPRRRGHVRLLEQSRRPPRPRCTTAGCTPATWARFDERGYLTLRDRSKDVVISGGSNIYPREVEEVLLEHPGGGRRPAWSGRPTPSGARSWSRSSSARSTPARARRAPAGPDRPVQAAQAV